MKRTQLTLSSADHENLAKAVKLTMKNANREARISLAKSVVKDSQKVFRVNIIFDNFDNELVEALQKTSFTNNVEASFRTVN